MRLPCDTFLLRLIRLLRILRLARLGRFSLAMFLLSEAVRSRRYELGLAFLIAGLVLIGSSSLMYALEGGSQPETSAAFRARCGGASPR